MTKSVTLDRIRHLDQSARYLNMPKPLPGVTTVMGNYRGLLFIATLSEDGHCEASLSVAATRNTRPGDGRCRDFFRYWGLEPLGETPPDQLNEPSMRHWVIAQGTEQKESGNG